jgi:hypothetical protein
MTITRSPRPATTPNPLVWVAAPIAAVMVLVSVLLVLGAFSAGPDLGAGSVNNVSSAPAQSVATQFAGRLGTWNLIAVDGVSSQNASYLRYNGTVGSSTCEATTLVGSDPTNLSIPASPGGLTSGKSVFWYFAFFAPGNGSELAVYVVSGHVVIAAEIPSACTGAPPPSVRNLPTSLVNSSTAVSAAAKAGGTDFVTNYTDWSDTVSMLLSGGVVYDHTPVGPTWEVSWSTCGSDLLWSGSSTSYGHEFHVAVNATTGVVLPGSATNTTCGSPGRSYTLGLSVDPGRLFAGPDVGGNLSTTGCDNGDYCYAVPLVASTANVTPANFSMLVQNSSTTYLGTVGFAILDVNGSVLVYSIGPTEDGWTSDVGTPEGPLTPGMTFIVDVGPTDPVTGLWGLYLTGLGAYAPAGTFGVGLDG